MQLASLWHHGQRRKDGSPALWHPLDVCRQLLDHGVHDEDLLCAGLLHDTLEDNPPHQRGEIEQAIRARVGAGVADWVLWLSDDPHACSASRKDEQLRRLRHAPVPVLTIKLADRLANLNSGPAPGWTPQKCQAYAAHTMNLLTFAAAAHPLLAHSVHAALRNPAWHA